MAEGAPADLAGQTALLGPLLSLSDVADLARVAGWPVTAAARIYHAVSARFAFDRLRAAAVGLLTGDPYQRQAARQLMEELLSEQALIARAIMVHAQTPSDLDEAEPADAAVQAWIATRQTQADAARRLVEEIESSGGGWSFPKLAIANAAMRDLAAAAI
jgi:glutamate dehydrogenase